MAIQKLTIAAFLDKAQTALVFDVRSPGEYAHAHIPGAISLPLFTDEERKVVGTAYKQKSRQQAIKFGLDFFGPKMKLMVEEVEAWIAERQPGNTEILVHCWRGGMRSGAVAWLLDLYGFKVSTLAGGYKAFRQWVLQKFDEVFPIGIVGGFTGSGKTEVLHQLQKQGFVTIDLEGLAHHKGSAFGNIGMPEQPTQEMFENKLAVALVSAHQQIKEKNQPFILLEDESQRIGLVNLPIQLYLYMKKQTVFFMEVPFDERINHIMQWYGKGEKDRLISAIIRIKKRLGGLETKTAINCLLEDDLWGCFAILLKYYDKWYTKSINTKPNLSTQLIKISCTNSNAQQNAQLVAAAIKST
jgi:tRNA 2-selenouridine synthase